MKLKVCSFCEHHRNPVYHSGFTGKSGPDTWHYCQHKKRYLRDIKTCELAGEAEKRREELRQKRRKW